MAAEQSMPETPTVEPIAPEQATPTLEATPQVQSEPVIYGGANPIVPEINIQEPQHQIYGGANPLENTQSIPISNLVGQQPVVQTPQAEPTIVTQQPTPVTENPTNIGQ